MSELPRGTDAASMPPDDEQLAAAGEYAYTQPVGAATGSHGLPLDGLEAMLGYRFRNRDLLLTALVHRSYLHDVPDFELGSNERLEFLGDAVLGFLVARWLYLRYPEESEGRLTARRGALVRLTRLSVWGRQVDLGIYLYMSRGEDLQGGRTRSTIIGRALEAVLGAVYLDGGLETADGVLQRFLEVTSDQEIDQVLTEDYKSQLQRLVQARFKLPPVYRLAATSGPAHDRSFTVGVWAGERLLGSGEGRNKQQAEQAAAREGMALLTGEDPDEIDDAALLSSRGEE